MSHRPFVIKIGGSTLGATDTTYADIAALARKGDVPVVVHGGGAEASRWLDAMHIPSRFERGLRVTDERVLPVVVAVFAGLVNKRIVAAIDAAGARAVGISGADARLLRCRIADSALGLVGEPLEVDPAPIRALLDAGLVPVISSIGCVPSQPADQLVNVNADTVAASVAAAVGARRLVFLTDVEGVRGPDGERIDRLDAARARTLVVDGTISGGMIPKIEACLHAAGLGVEVQIVDGRVPGALRSLDNAGTIIIPAVS
ncbi:acetylglutamate kinase [Tepidiforma sp.]|uniref:acetylglutamate kinase n=1 Tax=Tepidiforma sp. TaxID=2682230 RepID=UPI002ADDDF12|nr:acetylglutamate kinase [Tepidiforma sp.]